MTFITFYKWAFFITLVVLIEGCFDGQKKENNKSNLPSKAISEPKLKNEIKDEISESEDFQMKLWQKGIDFYARGNEPSWALDKDFDKGFYFKTLNGIEIKTPPVKGVKAMDANVIRYYTETESATLIITISEKKCNDSMSDEVFPTKVKI